MSDVTPMTPATARPDPDVIRLCESLLAQARSGELRSLVCAGALSGGRYLTAQETHDAIEAAGLLSMALHNTCAERRENAE